MENYLMLNGQRIELTSAQYEEIAKSIADSKKKSDFDRVNRGCTYSFINSGGSIVQLPDSEIREDNDRYDSANYCTNQKLMEQRAFYEKVERNLWRFSMENGGSGKYIICFDSNYNSFIVDRIIYGKYFGPTFKTDKLAKRAIDEVLIPLIEEAKCQPCQLFNWEI